MGMVVRRSASHPPEVIGALIKEDTMIRSRDGWQKRVALVGVWARVGVALALLGCTPALDVLGAEETVLEKKDQKSDELSRKSPEYDPDRTIEEEFDGCTLTLNKSASVTRLSVEKIDADVDELSTTIFPTRAAALEALGDREAIASMEVVNGALKPFNDGLYAAIELAVENGSDASLVNKRAILDALLETMLARAEAGDDPAWQATVDLAASLLMVNEEPMLSEDTQVAALRAMDDFEQDSFLSTPIGFYTWSDPLRQVFARDRFLQYQLGGDERPFDTAFAVAEALRDDENLRLDYERLLRLYAGLTNPSRHFAPTALADFIDSREGQAIDEGAFESAHPELTVVDPACGATYSWLPPSDSPERKLLASDYCDGNRPENLLARLIEAIQSGEVDLTPSEASGWYDWQLYALETLLVPERAPENEHLLLTQAYKDKLVETFKSVLIQTRETHVKQLEPVVTRGSGSPEPVDVYPLLPVEPFPTFFLRTARAYGFVKNVLVATLGEEALSNISRLHEDGSRAEASLAEELDEKAQLLYGLHMVAAASIGMADTLSEDERENLDLKAVEASARSWLDAWRTDPDVLVDPRVAVPLVRDDDAAVVRNLGVVGVKVIHMHASFPEGYEPELVSGGCPIRHFVPFEPYLLVEQTVEFTTPLTAPPLTRDEFRALLSGQRTLDDMVRALEAR